MPERREGRGVRGSERGRGRDALSSAEGRRGARSQQGSEPRPPAPTPATDPIFSQPYRPTDAGTGEKAEANQVPAKRPAQPVAALLGGMPFKKVVR